MNRTDHAIEAASHSAGVVEHIDDTLAEVSGLTRRIRVGNLFPPELSDDEFAERWVAQKPDAVSVDVQAYTELIKLCAEDMPLDIPPILWDYLHDFLVSQEFGTSVDDEVIKPVLIHPDMPSTEKLNFIRKFTEDHPLFKVVLGV